jgi:Arc/MetJ-type ribon-helix-helix transcriptional regulator
MTTVRLDVKSEAALKRLSARRGQSKSEVIRDAIALLAEEEKEQPSAYERLQPFIGIVDEGDPQLSEGTGKRLREILENRQLARRSG